MAGKRSGYILTTPEPGHGYFYVGIIKSYKITIHTNTLVKLVWEDA